MTKAEMLDAVRRVQAVDGTDEEIDALVFRLRSALPHAGGSDMIFYPDAERSPEQVVEGALRRERAHAAKEAAA